MKRPLPFLLAATMLTGCGPSDVPTKSDIPTVEALAANPVRLKELRQQCKTDRHKLGDMLCNRVAEASSRRFLWDGNTPYTPPKEPPKL
ncbi:lipoprotein [Pseudomonas panipatensis]|uniref:lipoprotein n=1 Tax=Pseudomonas panipatensis TaxID=428992 RepID=UPI0035B0888E